MYNKL